MSEQPSTERHASPRYGLVLIGLIVLTAIEVGVSYLTGGLKIGLLLTLAFVKAALVVLWFMHLKFDSRLYAVMFILGLVLIAPLVIFLIVTTP
ncbi:MAG TPA: cytochrome C oxidase subunit IV family protein [Anaerolineaceae bacterium]